MNSTKNEHKENEIIGNVPLKKIDDHSLFLHQYIGDFSEGDIKGEISSILPNGTIWIRIKGGGKYIVKMKDICQAVIEIEKLKL